MARTHALLWLLIAVIAAAFAAPACGNDNGDDGTRSSGGTPASGGAEPTASNQEVCDALDGFRSSLSTLTQSSSTEELQDNASKVRDSASHLREVTSESRLDAREDLDNSLDDFTKDIEDAAEGDRPFTGTITVVANAIVNVQEHLGDVQAEAGCG